MTPFIPLPLRHPEARRMLGFAEALFTRSDGRIPVGDDHFPALWSEVARMLGEGKGGMP